MIQGKSMMKHILENFEIVESAGTEVSYRCVKCRGCPDCKNSGNIECISIQEEVEQAVIDKSVSVNLELGYTQPKISIRNER